MTEAKKRLAVGPALTALRERNNIDQAAAGKLQGIGQSRVCRVETGPDWNVSFTTLYRWVTALGYDLYDFADVFYAADTNEKPNTGRNLEVAMRKIQQELRQVERVVSELSPDELETEIERARQGIAREGEQNDERPEASEAEKLRRA